MMNSLLVIPSLLSRTDPSAPLVMLNVPTVILSPSLVILSAAKDLNSPLLGGTHA